MAREKILELLEKEKIQGLYVVSAANIRFLSNFTGTNGSLFLTKKRGFLLTDARYFLAAKAVLPSWISIVDITKDFEKPWKKLLRTYRVRKLGIECSVLPHARFLRLKHWSKSVKMIDVGEKVLSLRIEKNETELRYLQSAQSITDQIFTNLKRWLKPGCSERAIAWKIECLAHNLGAEDISFPPIVGINEHSASPHHKNTDRKLKKGDILLLDFGVIYKGYCSDMTRVLFLRQPSMLEQKIYSLVMEAQETAEKALRSGMEGIEIDKIARDIIKKAGHGKQFGHSLGHGVGLEIHELPNLSEKYKKPIPAKAVVTVEPGIYLPGKFGVRLEDMGVVKKDGFEVFTKSPKAIQDMIIRL